MSAPLSHSNEAGTAVIALSEEQKREVVLILSVGCDRLTAANYTACTPDALAAAVKNDKEFAEQVSRAEASSELAHMRNLQQAGRDPRHWRSSVWWLERHAPERFGNQRAASIARSEIASFLAAVARAISESVRDDLVRRRLLDRIANLANETIGPSTLDPDHSLTIADSPESDA